MRALLVGSLALAACFNPKLGEEPFRCGAGGDCPPGYHCDGENICVLHDVDGGTRPADAPTGADARRDAPPRADAPPPLADAPPCTGDEVDTCLDENTALLCNGSEMSCAFRCDPAARLCEQCDPSKPTFCMGSDAVGTCTSDGQIGPGQSACLDFCLESGGGAGCVTLEPSNLPSTVCDAPAMKSRHVTAKLTVDTDVCADGTIVIQPSPGSVTAPSICLLVYSDITIDAAGGLTATGHNALALVATHDFVLNGIVDASAIGPTSGAGTPNPPPGLGKTVTSSYVPGGGGGGFAQNGGGGGTDSDDGAVSGGPSYGAPEIVPLAGGSPGGSGGDPPSICDVTCPQIGKGGGGGGALQLVACHAMSLGIVGHVSAEGGGGQGGFFVLPPLGSAIAPAAGGGGGGGAGGAIVLEAGRLDVNEFAFVSATGAGGGGGGTFLESIGHRGGDGEDGQIDHGANGGSGGSQFAGAGGDGSTGPNTTAPTPGPGLSAQMMGYGAGGGGGSVGRIRINTPAQAPFDATGLIVVPSPSTGAVKHH